jgi:hypothetical protein
MFNTIVGAGSVRAGTGAALRYGSGSDQKMRQHCSQPQNYRKSILQYSEPMYRFQQIRTSLEHTMRHSSLPTDT